MKSLTVSSVPYTLLTFSHPLRYTEVNVHAIYIFVARHVTQFDAPQNQRLSWNRD